MGQVSHQEPPNNKLQISNKEVELTSLMKLPCTYNTYTHMHVSHTYVHMYVRMNIYTYVYTYVCTAHTYIRTLY